MTPEDLIAYVFSVDRRSISESTSNHTLAEWDSLAHMTLVLEVERVYSCALSAEEVMTMTSVKALKELLLSRGISW